jgi:hypothetical protein
LAGHNRKDSALALLSRTERDLVAGILHRSETADGAGDPDFLMLAQLRLRNIVEKHSESLKRARLAARSDGPGNRVETVELQLWICSEALAVCRRHLHSAGGQD